MSTNLAHTMPLGLPGYDDTEYDDTGSDNTEYAAQPRHIEIVSTRSQRRARPRPIYALILVGGLFVLFIAQLLMSIVVSNGAYQISSLQAEQRELTQTAQALGEKNDLLSSPQSVATAAKKLGMGRSDTPPSFLVASTGEIIGKEKPASNVSNPGYNQVPNSLLADQKKAKAEAKAKAKADKAAADEKPSVADSTTNTTDSTTGSGAFPAPTQ